MILAYLLPQHIIKIILVMLKLTRGVMWILNLNLENHGLLKPETDKVAV